MSPFACTRVLDSISLTAAVHDECTNDEDRARRS